MRPRFIGYIGIAGALAAAGGYLGYRIQKRNIEKEKVEETFDGLIEDRSLRRLLRQAIS